MQSKRRLPAGEIGREKGRQKKKIKNAFFPEKGPEEPEVPAGAVLPPPSPPSLSWWSFWSTWWFPLLSDRFPSMNIDLTANQVNTLSEEALDVAKEVQYDTNNLHHCQRWLD